MNIAQRLSNTRSNSMALDNLNDNAENTIAAITCNDLPIATPGIIPMLKESQRTT
jgi:hypothetical protein